MVIIALHCVDSPLVLTSQNNFHTHTDLLGHITVVHSQATYNVLIGRLTLTAALIGTKGKNAAFCLKSLPTHAKTRMDALQLFGNLLNEKSNYS